MSDPTPPRTPVAAPALPLRVHACGFSAWKRPLLRRFVQPSRVVFVNDPQRIPDGETLLVWGRREVPPRAQERLRVVRVEDGFVRSVGLGVALAPPISWVFDPRGIHYDASTVSELEHILQTASFHRALVGRARRLRETIVRSGLTKYNLAGTTWRRPDGTRSVVLVVGQVESDAAIQWGAPGVRTNADLLQAVRRARPDAWLVYKPHPDVVDGWRAGGAMPALGEHCDEIVTKVGMAAMLDAVDEVHVMTSLAGFEALLRGRPVTTWGQPFYAGWGLTEDRLPLARRTRVLALDELVAGALILYPRYASPSSGRALSVEQAMDELARMRRQRPSLAGALARWMLRLVLRAADRGGALRLLPDPTSDAS